MKVDAKRRKDLEDTMELDRLREIFGIKDDFFDQYVIFDDEEHSLDNESIRKSVEEKNGY